MTEVEEARWAARRAGARMMRAGKRAAAVHEGEGGRAAEPLWEEYWRLLVDNGKARERYVAAARAAGVSP